MNEVSRSLRVPFLWCTVTAVVWAEPSPPVGVSPGADQQLALVECLSLGQRYAWVVRAVDAEGTSEWSEPRLFALAAGPNLAEVHETMAMLSAHLAAGGAPAADLEGRQTDRHRSAAWPPSGRSRRLTAVTPRA